MNTSTSTNIEHRADRIAQDLFQRQREYEADAEQAAKEGFRPHYCIHGTNLWTDYDNICGGCEDGEFTQYTSEDEVRAYARAVAEGEVQREARQKVVVDEQIEVTIELAQSLGTLTSKPRIFRDGAAAAIILTTPRGEQLIEIAADGTISKSDLH